MVSFTKIVASAFAFSAAIAAPATDVHAKRDLTGGMIAHRADNYAVIVLTFLNMPPGTFSGDFSSWGTGLQDQIVSNFMTSLHNTDQITWNFWDQMIQGQWGDSIVQKATILGDTEWVYEAKIQLSAASGLIMQSRIIQPVVDWLAHNGITASVRLLPNTKRDDEEPAPVPVRLAARGNPSCPANPEGSSIYKYATGDPKEIDMSGAGPLCH